MANKNAQQELESVGILGATIAPGNTVTVIHQQQVPPALLNRIKNLEQANKSSKSRELIHKDRTAVLENKLKIEASRIQALELKLKAQTAIIENLEQHRQAQELKLHTYGNHLQVLDASQRAQATGIKTLGAHQESHRTNLEHYKLCINSVVKSLESAGENFKSQKARMDKQERELNEKFVQFESNLLQRFKQMILAELLSLETQPSREAGDNPEPYIKAERT